MHMTPAFETHPRNNPSQSRDQAPEPKHVVHKSVFPSILGAFFFFHTYIQATHMHAARPIQATRSDKWTKVGTTLSFFLSSDRKLSDATEILCPRALIPPVSLLHTYVSDPDRWSARHRVFLDVGSLRWE